MKPTIRDIARRANVSVATVSRVLNGLPGFSAKTEEIVRRAMADLEYRPNAIARGLASSKTHTLGVVFPEISSFVTSDILHGIEQQAQKAGYTVVVCNIGIDGKRALDYFEVLHDKQIDGLIVSNHQLPTDQEAALLRMQIPVVLISSLPEEASLPYIKIDDREAARLATRYLVELGHRHIGMISGEAGDRIAGQPRIEGYQAALAELGSAAPAPRIAYGDFRFRSGVVAMHELLDNHPELTAVFAASDEMALGAIRAATKRGLKVPDDISVVGFDDTKMSEMSQPALTTVSQPFHELGAGSVALLFALMDKGRAESRILQCTLVERESARAPANSKTPG